MLISLQSAFTVVKYRIAVSAMPAIVSKRIVTFFQYLVSSFSAKLPLQNSKGNSLSRGVKYTGWEIILDFQPKLPFISEMACEGQ